MTHTDQVKPEWTGWRPAPEADLTKAINLAKQALAAGVMIDPEEFLCELLHLEPAQLPAWLDPEPAELGRTYRSGDTVIVNPKPCRHEESLYGRCTACGMTWEQQTAAADRSQPPSPAREEVWRQAEAGTLAHLMDRGRPLCGSQDAGPWRTMAGAVRCAACVDLSEVLARHG